MKIILTLVASLVCFSLFAQINKGQWMMGGSLSGMYQVGGGDNDYKQKTFQAPVNVGYFVANGMALGIRGSALYDETTYTILRNYYYYYGPSSYEVKTKTQQYSVGPFFRAYLMPNRQKFNFYVEPHFAYGWYDATSNISSGGWVSEKVQSYSLNVAPVILLSPHTSMEFILSYNYTNYTKTGNNSTSFLFGVGFQVFLGNGKVKETKVQ